MGEKNTDEKEGKSIGRNRFLKTEEMDNNKFLNIWSFVMTHFMGKNWYKICRC